MKINMKKFIFLFIASLIIGSVVYTVMYLVVHIDKNQSLSVAVGAAMAGIITEYLRPYFVKLEKQQKDSITNRVRRNLRRQRKVSNHT